MVLQKDAEENVNEIEYKINTIYPPNFYYLELPSLAI